MKERHTLAVARTFVTAITLGLAVILIEPHLSPAWQLLGLAAYLLIDLCLLLYLWLATTPEPEEQHPSTARAIYERRQRRPKGTP
jgi:hypothetical protein